MTAEARRLEEDRAGVRPWKRWGPYVSERAWGTVREDYSATGAAWESFPHDHARSRAYRWNEDGLAGICDRHQRIVFALALWNGRDPILKERLFGLTGKEGNHGAARDAADQCSADYLEKFAPLMPIPAGQQQTPAPTNNDDASLADLGQRMFRR